MSDSHACGPSTTTSTPVRPAHLYVHVPLCRSMCSYCDFYSVPGDVNSFVPLVDALVAETRRWRTVPAAMPARTLYVGGGTPSVLGPLLPDLVSRLREIYGLAPDAEVTVEANPDTLTQPLAEALVAVGVTRISVGVQSFDDSVLTTLDRPHDAAGARRATAAVVASGADLSVDLMCGVPGQKPSSWRDSVAQAVGTGAAHVSVYPLSLETGTPFAEAVHEGRMKAPDSDTAADMMISAEEQLASAGLLRYEVANYARPGHESKHNHAYWTGSPYAGVGPAAHGMVGIATAHAIGIEAVCPESDTCRVRYANPCDVEGYVAGRQWSPEVEVLSGHEAMREDVMLGMRRVDGVDERLVQSAGVGAEMASLARDGLVEWSEGRWRTTQTGWLLGNEVFGRIWNGE
jgi:oxygen-independent coproporphyrinogen III oxidase